MWKNLLLLLATGLGCFALAEGAARLLLAKPPMYRVPQTLHDRHPTLGWVVRPDQDAFTQDRRVHVNGAGMRDDEEVPATKPPGELRVLALGDSFTFANGVEVQEGWVDVLERLLRERGLPVRTLNTGVQGWNVHQEATFLEERGLSYAPDAIVVGFYGNDCVLDDKSGYGEAGRIADDGRAARGGLRGLLTDEVIYALKRIHVVALAAYALNQAQYRFFPDPGDYLTAAIYRDVVSPASTQAWADIRKSLTRIRDLAHERGIPLVVAVFPMAPQATGVVGTAGYQDRLLAVTRELGIETVDVLPALRAADESAEPTYIPFDGHFAPAGHRIAARELAGPVARALAGRAVASPPAP